jgi:hypothetical protein
MSDDSPSRNFQNDEQIIFLPSHKIARGKVPPFRQVTETDAGDAHSQCGSFRAQFRIR